MICFEHLSLLTFFSFLFKFNDLKKKLSLNSDTFYFIDSSFTADWILIPIITFFGKKVDKLNFKLMEIKDDKGELIRYRIPRFDLFKIQNKIINSKSYKELYHQNWNQNSVIDYINKGIVDGGIDDKKSISRVLFLIEVINWHMKTINCDKSLFVLNERSWIDIYEKIAANYQINLLGLKNIQFSDIKKIIRNNIWLYGIVKNLKYNNIIRRQKNTKSSSNMLFIEGRGDLNPDNDGTFSDFFWQFNSEFPKKNIIYKYYSDDEKNVLIQHGIFPVPERVIMDEKTRRNFYKIKLNKTKLFQIESQTIKSLLSSYNLDKFYWRSFFKFYNVKIFLSWDKYNNNHIAMLDAIKDNDGILAFWQNAFDGFPFADCVMNADINFCHSQFSLSLEKKLKSKIKYNIVTGYCRDYATPFLKKRANNLRKKLKENGAKKIIFVMDEMSIDDNRWHTGHELQQENYSFILEKLLETSWLGVIFKPKSAKTLRKRLGTSITELLDIAEKTGRCFVYEESTRYTTRASPVLAGLSADICIHAHLGAGTAAIECALEGLPTLLIDREGAPFSKLSELPLGKVVFKDWITTIRAIMEHFNKPGGIKDFGDWTSIINDLDPFRDGKAAYRIGTYLHWLIQGYNQGLNKETIMFEAAERYKKEWGEDKVIAS